MNVVQLRTGQEFPSTQQEDGGYRASRRSVNDCVIHAATVSIGGSQRDPAQ